MTYKTEREVHKDFLLKEGDRLSADLRGQLGKIRDGSAALGYGFNVDLISRRSSNISKDLRHVVIVHQAVAKK